MMSKANHKVSSSSWVSNLYRNLEHICHEVDDAVCQGTVRYVGDHVKAVSENVKKFCSEAVQDLLHAPSKLPSAHSEAGPSYHDSDVTDDDNEECPSIIDAEKVPCNSHSHQNYVAKDETDERPSAVGDELFSCKEDATDTFDDYGSCESYSSASGYHVELVLSTPSLVEVTMTSTDISLCQVEGTIMNDDVEKSKELKDSHSDEVSVSEYLGEEMCKASSSSDGSIIPDASFNEYSPLLATDHVATSNDASDATITSSRDQHVASVSSCEDNILETSPMSLISLEIPKDSATSTANLFAEVGTCGELDHTDEHLSPTTIEKICGEESDNSFDGSSIPLAVHPVTCVISRECEVSDAELAFASVKFSRIPEVSPANLVMKEGECCELNHLVIEHEEMCDGDFNNVSDDSSGLSRSQPAVSVTSCENSVTDAESTLPGLPGNTERAPVDLPVKEEENCFGIGFVEESYTYFPISLDSSDDSSSSSSPPELCGEVDEQNIEIEDPKMQKSELPKKIRLKGLGLLAAHNVHHALRRSAKDLCFYKKKLQHALTSRKRTEKEYKQLVIWYGDIDADLDELIKPTLLHSVATIPVSIDSTPKNSPDSEWELV